MADSDAYPVELAEQVHFCLSVFNTWQHFTVIKLSPFKQIYFRRVTDRQNALTPALVVDQDFMFPLQKTHLNLLAIRCSFRIVGLHRCLLLCLRMKVWQVSLIEVFLAVDCRVEMHVQLRLGHV